MNENSVTTKLCGKEITYSLLHKDSLCFFDKFRTDYSESARKLAVTEEQIAESMKLHKNVKDPAEIELGELCYMTSDLLLEDGYCIFHGVSMLINGKAWILTAPSGTGKTTQYVLWKRLLGDRVKLMNGDKPFIGLDEEGNPWVFPSPWRGKENMGSMEKARLGGVIYLCRGEENSIRPLEISEAVTGLFDQMLFNATDADSVLKACRILEPVLKNGNLWLLKNRGDMASAKLAYEKIKEAL